MNPITLNCIAVDDEPLALKLVCAYIEQTPFLKLVGRYDSAIEALQGLHEHGADLVFLDIQMPNLNGLNLAKALGWNRIGTAPMVVFTTAYDQYALEGYKVDALDYLLKPFGYEEFLRAAGKASTYAERFRSPAPVPVALPEPEDAYLYLKVEYQLVRVAFRDIFYMEGMKDYVKVFTEGSHKPLLSLTSLKALEEKLPSRRFMRLHRSYIVSLEKIQAVTKNSVQIGGINIQIRGQYKEPFSQFLSRWAR